MNDPIALSDLQLAIMRCLWQHGEATSAQVHRDLEPERGLAPTTVATMLRRMEARGVIDHRTAGRQFIYRAIVSEGDVRRTMVGELTGRLFRGDPAALVNHILTEGEIDARELARLRALIDERAETLEEGER